MPLGVTEVTLTQEALQFWPGAPKGNTNPLSAVLEGGEMLRAKHGAEEDKDRPDWVGFTPTAKPFTENTTQIGEVSLKVRRVETSKRP